MKIFEFCNVRITRQVESQKITYLTIRNFEIFLWVSIDKKYNKNKVELNLFNLRRSKYLNHFYKFDKIKIEYEARKK